jgi:hypothetical protein
LQRLDDSLSAAGYEAERGQRSMDQQPVTGRYTKSGETGAD